MLIDVDAREEPLGLQSHVFWNRKRQELWYPWKQVSPNKREQ